MTLRLKPSALLGLFQPYPGTLALPVPRFHCAEVSTYPLRVVADSAVRTELGFSSACVTAGKLTTPALSKPNVHALNFMILVIGFFVRDSQHARRVGDDCGHRVSAATRHVSCQEKDKF